MIRELLEESGCTTDLARTGTDAIRKAKEKTYDLILMDIGLPDMSGTEITRKIRQFSTSDTPPIVALTGHLTEEKRKECLESGMQNMYAKPASPDIIQKILTQYVLKRSTKNISTTDRKESKNKKAAVEILNMLSNSLPNDMILLKAES